ncbi:MAG: hypothetical protein H0V63_12015 [Burkholderiaceae bacterium]|nr:hypothetical protein [Burkholderiaceae bacterium]
MTLALATTASVASDLRGFVSEGAAGVLQYQPCAGAVMSQQLFPIDDKTPNSALREGVGAVRQIMLNRYRPLYVEMRGDRGKTNSTAYQFQRAVGTVESCKSLPRDIASNVRLLAIGEGQSWRLVVTDAAAVLELPDKVTMKLSVASFKTAGTDQSAKETLLRAYEVRSTEGVPIRVEVNPQMCTDGKSETAYGARVVVRVDKRVLQGCAARF